LAASNYGGTPGTTLVAIGNVFPNDTPFRIGDLNALLSLGNVYVDRGHALSLPAYLGPAHQLSPARLAATGLSGISETSVAARNLRGSFTIAEGATTETVRFKAAEQDANYFVTITPGLTTGRPATGSNRLRSVTKSTMGFTAAVEAAPGPGSNVTFDWHLIR
jgi:hypothetical protein